MRNNTKAAYGPMWDKLFFPQGVCSDPLGDWFWVEIPPPEIRMVDGKWVYAADMPVHESPYGRN